MSGLLIGALIISSIVVVVMPFTGIPRSLERRIFWCMVPAVSVAGALSTYPSWNHAALFAMFPIIMMTFAAWAYTPYLKIGGKIYALNVNDRRPDPDEAATDAAAQATADLSEIEYDDDADDFEATSSAHHRSDSDPGTDSYSGMLTPTTMWWVIVGLSVIAAGNIYAYIFSDGTAPVAIVMAAFLSLLALATGYGDASWGHHIARGSYIPFSIASVVTAGAFAAIYLAAYYTARHWPLRRTQSMEHQAHHRHEKHP